MNKLLILLIAIVFVACDKENTVTINTNISDPEVPQLLIMNEVEMIFDTISDFNGTPFVLPVGEKPSILKVQFGRLADYIYISPGAEITINKERGSRVFNIENSNDAEQKLLAEFDKQMDIASAKYSLNEIANGSEEDFEHALSLKYEEVNKLLAEHQDASQDLISWLEARIIANKIESKVYYPDYYEYIKKEEPVISADFYKTENDLDLSRKELFYFDDMKSAALSLLGRGVNFEDYEDFTEYYAARYKVIDERVENPEIAEILKFGIINDKINYAGGIQGFEDQINEYLKIAKDPNKKIAIENQVAKWAHLKKGAVAPDFTALTRDGEEVKLSDLKGKHVYIDVWATWCGPCLAEIPSLKSMEEKYHGQNLEFVSVSIDKESDREKWKNFVMEKDLKGIQIMTNEAWQAKMTTDYNISGIPRFIMIDENGALVSADAPRPSNTVSFTKMVDGLLN
ncbi:redoxin family protein [Portibacter lacus]|nr:redoxin family protein [Portibacter lacus]